MRARRVGVLSLLAGLGLLAAAPLVGGAAGTTSSAYAAQPSPGVELPSGRLVTPLGSAITPIAGGSSYDLGDFPQGIALAPDGSMAVASLNGRGMGSPHGFNSFCEQNQSKPGYTCPGVPDAVKSNPGTTAPDQGLDVIDAATGKVTQAVQVPTSNDPAKTVDCGKGFNCFSYGVTFGRDGKHVYATGGGGDDIVEFTVSNGTLVDPQSVVIPSLATQVPADPVSGGAYGYPHGIAATPDGKDLVVVDTYDSTIELLSLDASGTPTLVAQQLMPGGVPGQAPLAYLYDVVVSPDSSFAYVTAEGTGTVYVVSLTALALAGVTTQTVPQTTNVQQLGQLAAASPAVVTPYVVQGIADPTGLALSPDGSLLAVAGTNTDNVAIIPIVAGAVAQSAAPTLVHLGAAPRASGVYGSAPDAVAWSRDGSHLFVALAGDDADAVLDVAAGATPVTPTATVAGYLPTAWYPTAVAVSPKDGRLWTVSAKGLGSRYVAGIGGYTPAPGTSLPSGASIPSSDYYDAENMPGLMTAVPVPADTALAAYSTMAADDILHAGGLDQRSPDNPIPVAVGGSSPITHVVYIVRENRTFDQVFGDLALTRQDVDADPADQELAAATPNAHALANRYAIPDHYFSDGEASVQGHWWTAGANVDDYVEKDWRQYYSPRHAPSDSAILPITTPPGCTIFQEAQAYQQTHPGFTFENYGELVGTATPSSSLGNVGANTCQNGLPVAADGLPVQDPNYPTQASLTPDDRTRAAEFLKDSGLNADGTPSNNGNSLKNFQYLIMSEDHTSGLAGTQTPRSQVAQNDAAIGEVISALSKSSYWSSTAVFVTEDDSQDGTDHVDGHRNVAIVASPYAKQVSADGCLPGYVGHAHYDQASMLRTIELILGFSPLSAYDSGATPMYDLFQNKDSASELTPADLAPYNVAPAPSFIDETVASLPHTQANTALIDYSKTLDTKHADVAEAGIESVLWQTLRSDPVPEQLAAAAGSGSAASDDAMPSTTLADGTGETESAATDSGSQPDLELPEVRPGTPPALSTVTGEALRPAAASQCAAPVVLTTPVKPGQTTLPGKRGGHAPASASGANGGAPRHGVLAATGLGLVVPVAGLVLVGLGAVLVVKRPRRI